MLATRDRYAAFRSRRVVVKSRIVKLCGLKASTAPAPICVISNAMALLATVVRVTLFTEQDRVDAKRSSTRGRQSSSVPFHRRAEDGAEYEDLKTPHASADDAEWRRTSHEAKWVAVDHYNTAIHTATSSSVGKDDAPKTSFITRVHHKRNTRACRRTRDAGPRRAPILKDRDRLAQRGRTGAGHQHRPAPATRTGSGKAGLVHR